MAQGGGGEAWAGWKKAYHLGLSAYDVVWETGPLLPARGSPVFFSRSQYCTRKVEDGGGHLDRFVPPSPARALPVDQRLFGAFVVLWPRRRVCRAGGGGHGAHHGCAPLNRAPHPFVRLFPFVHVGGVAQHSQPPARRKESLVRGPAQQPSKISWRARRERPRQGPVGCRARRWVGGGGGGERFRVQYVGRQGGRVSFVGPPSAARGAAWLSFGVRWSSVSVGVAAGGTRGEPARGV